MNLDVTPVFEKNYDCDKRIVINRGGTRSSKTKSILQQNLLWLLTGKFSNDLYLESGVSSIVRKTRTALKRSVYRDFIKILHETNTYNLFDHNKTDLEFSYQGRLLEFFGADDEQKLRGTERDILNCSEANELDYDNEWFQLLVRTKSKAVIDFNPDDEYIWINEKLEQERMLNKGDVGLIVSTYKDNPFLSKMQVEEIEYLMQSNPSYWKIYGLGEYGHLEGRVYDFEIVELKDIEHIPVHSYGLDFGFTNDPCAMIETRIDGNKLYWHEIIYETGLLNSDLIDIFKVFRISKNVPIVADSAEPKSIEEIRRAGYNIFGCTKGADSVKHGIDKVQSYDLKITSLSLSTIKEARRYVWMQDKSGRSLNKPIDRDNHSMDAGRYSIDFVEKASPLGFY